MIRFVAINDYGNRFYLDNINISEQNIFNNIINNEKTSFFIYPNPNNGVFSIKTNTENAKIKIYDLMGKLLHTQKLNNNHENINLSNITKGLYIVELYTNHLKEVKKIIIK